MGWVAMSNNNEHKTTSKNFSDWWRMMTSHKCKCTPHYRERNLLDGS